MERKDKNVPEGTRKKTPIVRVTDPGEVRKLFKVRPEFRDIEDRLIEMIAEEGCILKGHFVLREDGEQ